MSAVWVFLRVSQFIISRLWTRIVLKMHLISLHDKRQTALLLRTRTHAAVVREIFRENGEANRTNRPRDERRDEGGNILMTKYEMTFAFGGKKSRNERTNELWMEGNTEQSPRAVYGTPQLTEWARTHATTTRTPHNEHAAARNVLIWLCYLLRQLKRRRRRRG